MLLVILAALYWFVCTCDALNETSPAPTRVIKLPDESIVATLVLLLLYTISTLALLLVGRVVIANDASPNVFDDATVNVDDESVDVPRATVSVLLVLVALLY